MDQLVLYHFPMSGSSQKLRLVLAEKGLAWESREVDLLAGEQHGASYRRINPDGFVPVLFHGSLRLTEVAATAEYLDETFVQQPLRPAWRADRHRMRCWVKFVDEVVHPANGFLSYAIAGRAVLLRMSAQQIDAYLAAMTSARDRNLRRIAIEQGIEAAAFAEAVLAHDRLLERMEEALEEGPFLAGAAISLADLAVLPYVRRLSHLGIGPIVHLERRPNVAAWLEVMTNRPSYRQAIVDYLPAWLDDASPIENDEALAAAWSALAGESSDDSAGPRG